MFFDGLKFCEIVNRLSEWLRSVRFYLTVLGMACMRVVLLFLLFQTVLVFPGEGSVTLEELHEKLGVSTVSESQHVLGPIDKCHQDSESRQPSISGQNCNSDITVSAQKDCQPDSDKLGKTVARTDSETIDDSTSRLEGTDVNEAETESPLDSNKSEMSVKRMVTDNGGACLPIDRVVFIDSTWNQTRSICQDERLKGNNELFSDQLNFQ